MIQDFRKRFEFVVANWYNKTLVNFRRFNYTFIIFLETILEHFHRGIRGHRSNIT